MMPFRLKNVGATYQRIVIRTFKDKIGSTVEVYFIDMVVKSREDERHDRLEQNVRNPKVIQTMP